MVVRDKIVSGPLREQFFAVAAGLPLHMPTAGVRGLQGYHGGERWLDCGFKRVRPYAPKGQEVSWSLIKSLKNFAQQVGVKEPILARVKQLTDNG